MDDVLDIVSCWVYRIESVSSILKGPLWDTSHDLLARDVQYILFWLPSGTQKK